MVNYEVKFVNVNYNPDFLFAAHLEQQKKNPWRNIFRMITRKHILVS